MTDQERYEAACHAMLSGVAGDLNPKPQEPKHLRAGVNTAMCDQAGLVQLLVEKGIITNEEYLKAAADSMEREVERYRARLKEQYGVEIKLA